MSVDRLAVVLAAMSEVDGSELSMIDRVCGAAVGLLGVTGCGLSLMVDGHLQGSAGVSEVKVAMVQELQLELGEGPCVDAWGSGDPVGEADLADVEGGRWPMFSAAAVEAGVQAVFAFPLRQGAIRIGVLILCRVRAGPLSDEERALGVMLADVASHVVLALQAGAPDGEVHALLAGEPPHWAEVHQATGMVAAALGVSVDEAFVRLRAHAFAERRSLRDVARDIVARRLRLQTAE